MPPHLRWRTTALQSLARQPRSVLTRTRNCCGYRPGTVVDITAANLRRYANVAGTVHHTTRGQHEDTLRVEEHPKAPLNIPDIIRLIKDALVAIRGIRNEDSKALEQISTACESFLQPENGDCPSVRISGIVLSWYSKLLVADIV